LRCKEEEVAEESGLMVRSHVGRDLQQSAQLFNTDRKVVWEYVSNSLQYVGPDVAPVVSVTLRSREKSISIIDNGRGMDWDGLKAYFVMHGENVDRKAGKGGRGFFGTGKSAAFGIADVLRVESVRDGRKSAVELTRKAIEAESSEHGVPLRTLQQEVATDEPNGTRVDIEGIRLGRLDTAGVIEHIERNLAYWRRDAQVFVNNRECEYVEPEVERTWAFRPDGKAGEVLGNVELVIKKAYGPLDEAQRGIVILANGVVHEVTLGTSAGKEMSQYIFGSVDVPVLDLDTSTPAAFTMDRSGVLNKSNATVQMVFAFIDPRIAEIRELLVAEARERRQTEAMRKLREEAERIAVAINEDFRDFRTRISRARARARGPRDAYDVGGADASADDLVFGDELPATRTPMGSNARGGEATGEGARAEPNVALKEDSTTLEGQEGGGSRKPRKSSGGFCVEFEHQGEESRRTKYLSENRTIYVNLDHPQIKAAKGTEDGDSGEFKRLAYEVAFSEYAVALAQELADGGFYLEVQEALFEIRERVDQMARRSASLYEKGP
jgi:hypothetical protein